MLLIMYITNDKANECPECPTTNEQEENALTKEEKDIYNDLHSIGKQIYLNNKYKEFEQQENGMYYATYETLKNLGYDVSKYSNCVQQMGVIYFDPDNVLNIEYVN